MRSLPVSVTLELIVFLTFMGRTFSRALPNGNTSPHSERTWWGRGQRELEESLRVSPDDLGTARNILLFIGDGMGMSTITAARFLKAQTTQQDIRDTRLSWEHFPYTGLAKTYTTDQQTADSAGTATAFLTGHKTRSGTVGVNEHVTRGNCTSVEGQEVKSILDYAHQAGKWTGIVTNTRVTHATPASAYAHSPDRSWESDADIPEPDREYCKDIARQLVEDNHFIRVMMGGGRLSFLPREEYDPERPYRGERQDGRNLIKEWEKIQRVKTPGDRARVVMNLTQFEETNTSDVDYLLGLFEASHMQFESDRTDTNYEKWGEPSLAEMTAKAVNILKKGPHGFFLLVEGGRIDHAHHDGNAYRALTDTVALSDAVQAALQLVNISDTLMVVTADHSHTLTMGGYSTLNNDILGLADEIYSSDKVRLALGDDKLPYTTLNYANGPGWYYHRANNNSSIYPSAVRGRRNLTRPGLAGHTGHKDFRQDALFPVKDETHGGEDVPVYAIGPMSHLLTGTHEQSYIAHALMYASCVGPNQAHCSVDMCTNCWYATSSKSSTINYLTKTNNLTIFTCIFMLLSFLVK